MNTTHTHTHTTDLHDNHVQAFWMDACMQGADEAVIGHCDDEEAWLYGTRDAHTDTRIMDNARAHYLKVNTGPNAYHYREYEYTIHTDNHPNMKAALYRHMALERTVDRHVRAGRVASVRVWATRGRLHARVVERLDTMVSYRLRKRTKSTEWYSYGSGVDIVRHARNIRSSEM